METPVGASFKEKLHIEIKKLRDMKFKEKVEYIWEYYKFPIIGICAVLLIIGGLLSTRLFNPSPKTALFISWNSGFATTEQITGLKDSLEEQILEGEKNKEVIISHFITSGANPSLDIATTQRLIALVAAGTIDIFILDSRLLEEKTTGGFLRPMETLLAETKAFNPTIYSVIEENITGILYEHDEGNVSERVMGIGLGSSPLLSELEIDGQELYFSISITTENTENIIKALIAFFE